MRRLVAATVVVGAVLACDEPVQPPSTGSIRLAFQSQAALQASASRSAAEAQAGARDAAIHGRHPTGEPDSAALGSTESLPPRAAAGEDSAGLNAAVSALTGARIVLSGPTAKDTTVTLVSGSGNVTIASLKVGTYTVRVFGLVVDTVDSYGQADNVSITAGQSTQVDLSKSTVPWGSVQPTLAAFTPATTTFLTVRANWSRVGIASGYRVEWADNANFTSSQSSNAPDTTALLTVSTASTYFVRVFATASGIVNPRASAAKSFQVQADTVGNAPAAATTLQGGIVGALNDSLLGLNIVPAGDEDWFNLRACSLDTITVETRAQRLVPPSAADTRLWIYRSDGTTQVAFNEDLDGTTKDSRIVYPVTTQDTFKIEVAGVGSTTGGYNLYFQLTPGPENTGSACVPLPVDTVHVSPSSLSFQALNDTSRLTATGKDRLGRTASTATFTWATRNGAIASVNGTGLVTATGVGGTWIVATSNGKSDSAQVTVTQGVSLAQSQVTVSAGSVAADSFVTFKLIAKDALGSRLQSGGLTVAFGTSGGTSAGTIGTVVDSGNGAYTASFRGETVGTAATVGATINGNAVTSSLPTVTVRPGPVKKLAFQVQPGGATAGQPIAPTIKVIAQDTFGNQVPTVSGTVNMSIGNNPTGANLLGAVNQSFISGVASYADLKIDKSGNGYTLKVKPYAASGLVADSAFSTAFSITEGGAKKVAFIVQPSHAGSGVSIAPAIQVAIQDSLGNTATGAGNPITLALDSNPGGSTLSGTLTQTPTLGIATFNDISLDKLASGYRLKARATGLDSARSATFNITAGAPARLLFTQQPSNTVAGNSVTPSVQVTLLDGGGNPVTSATDSVTVAILDNPGSATLSGTKKVAAVAGVATFNNLTLNKTQTNYTLLATSGSLTPDTSAAFDIAAGAPYQLAFGQQPTPTASGAVITPSPTVRILDALGNFVPAATNQVTLTLVDTTSAGGTLSGTGSRNAVAGTATFNDLNVDKAGIYRLSAAGASITAGATSDTFRIVASATVSASQSGAVASPTAGVRVARIAPADSDSVAFRSVITVTVRDPGGNPIPGQTVALSSDGTGNAITQPAGNTNGSGVATAVIRSSVAELKTLTLTVNPSGTPVVLTQHPTVQFVADTAALSASLSTATASPDTVIGDGTQHATITVTVRDTLNNPVASRPVLLTLCSTCGGTLVQPGLTNGSGVTTGEISRVGGGQDTVKVYAKGGQADSVQLNQKPVVFFQADTLLLSVDSSLVTFTPDSVTADGSAFTTITVTVRDTATAHNPIAGDSVYVQASGTGNSIVEPTGVTVSDGIKSASLRSTVAEYKTITVTVFEPNGSGGWNSRVLAAHPQVYFKAGTAAGFAFKVQPSNTVAGATVSPSVQVAVVDAHGNTVTDETRAIRLDDGDTTTADSLFGTRTVSAVSGVATYGDLSIRVTGSHRLHAVDVGAMLPPDTSDPFTILPSSGTHLAFQVQPSNVAAGVAITPSVQVRILDTYGNTVTSASDAVTLAIANNPGTATLFGTKTRNAVAGVATFNDVYLDKVGSGYTLSAAAGGLTGATSSGFDVSAAGASRLKFTTQPTTSAAGAAIPSVVVTVQDAFGNTVTGDAGSVDVAIADDPTGGAATLSGTTTQAASGGVATFGDLSIDKAAVNYSLTATRTGLTADFSVHFNITPGAATHLAFTQQPTAAAAGAAISPAVKIAARDAHGNTATSFTGNVTIAIGTDPSSGATLSGTTMVAAVAGVATFSTLSLDKVANGYTLTGSASGLTDTTSNPFNILAGVPARVGFVQQPTTTAAGSFVAPAVTVQIEDQYGNPIGGLTNAVTLSMGVNAGGGTLLGKTTVSAVNGLATFDSVTIDKAATGYKLAAASGAFTPDTSAAFDLSAGAPSAHRSRVAASPASVIADGVQVTTVTVVVRDSFANPVPAQTVTLGATGSSNTITNPSGPTDGSGTATGTVASTTAEAKTLSATVGGSLLLDSTAAVTFIADSTNVSASTSTVSVSPATVLADGSATSTITVTVKDPGGNPIVGKAVTLAASGANNTVTQPSGTTDGSGVATGTVASTTAEIKTVTATVDGKLFVQQPTVTFTAGLPAQLGFRAQPTATPAGGVMAPVQVEVQDAHGNFVDTSAVSVGLALTGGTAGAALYGTTPVAAVAGVATFSNLRIDSVGTSYRLSASSTGLTGAASDTFTVLHGPVYTVAVTPTPDSMFVLGGTRQFTGHARDSVGNVIDTVYTWSSTSPSVATVDPSTGLATAAGRGLAQIQASVGGKTGSANLAVAVRLAELTTGSTAPGQIFSSGDLPGRVTVLDATTFNGMSPAQLRNAYDVLLIQRGADATLNLDWATYLRPYIALGGGVVWEDDGATNRAKIAAIATPIALSGATAGMAVLATPRLSAGVTASINQAYLGFTTWSDSLAHFIVRGDTAVALYGRFGNGCAVFDGPADGSDGDRAGTATQANQYHLLLNEVRFAADCPLNASPGAAVSVRVFPKGHAFTDVSQTTTLRATALDAEGTPIPNHVFTWASANDTVATVDPGTGQVTSAHSGQVAIRADGSGTDYALITVGAPASPALNGWGTEVAAGVLQPSYWSAMWGTSVNNLWVGGAGGKIAHYNGAVWDTLTGGSGQWLWSAWGSSDNDIYMVGTSGALLHYNGSWAQVTLNADVSSSFYGVWGSAPSDVFAVGSGGVIQHFDGTSWQSMPNPAHGVSDLYGVWGSSARNVWVVGTNSTLMHYDGATWTSITSPLGDPDLFRVWGSDPNNVWIVTLDGGNIGHFDGSTWTTQTNPAPGYPFYGLWGTSANEIYAVGAQTIIKYNGTTWTKMDSPTTDYVLTAWGTADGQFRAAGGTGQIWHGVRGAVPASVTVTPSGGTATSISGTVSFVGHAFDASGNVITSSSPFSWASANTSVGTIDASTGVATAVHAGQTAVSATLGSLTAYAMFTATENSAVPVTLWDSTASSASAWIWTMWGSRSGNIFAGGSGGDIQHYNGTSWSTMTTLATSQIRGIWGTSDTDVWAVGATGGIFHYNGSTWTADPASGSVTTQTLMGVWGSATNDVWAVGLGGTFIHYDGSSWSAVSVPAAAGVDMWGGIWGASRDAIFAAGTGGRIFRYDGTTWSSSYTVTGTPVLYRIWGTAANNVYVVGSVYGGSGTIYRYNGSSWSQMTSNTTGELYSIWGAGANDIYAVGQLLNGVGSLMHYDGSTWTPMVSRTAQYIYSVWGTEGSSVWVGANGGQIRRGARGGSFTVTPQASFSASNLNTKMNLSSDGSYYRYPNGGVAGNGYIYRYSLAGARVDSVFTGIDMRSLLYYYGTHYLKSYGSNWYSVNVGTGAASLIFSSGFANSQSVPTVNQLGPFEIWEFTANTIRRLSSTGALLNTVTGVSGGTNAVATDGYYIYTQSGNTIYVYSAPRVTLSNTAQLVGSFTVPSGTSIYSLSYANGMLFTTDGSTWYGYRIGVSP